jgi:acetyl-CoA carboxylase biotin carboxyl carrier protein
VSERQDTEVRAVLDTVMRLLRSEPGPVTRLRVESGEAAVELEWAAGGGHEPVAGRNGTAAPALAAAATATLEPPDAREAADLQYLTAPMIGTFYQAPGPGEPPFVRVGDVVEPGQQVGILEAMKLMNPIEADRAGRVVEILVPDATAVEYDQRLIALGPVDKA